MHRLDDIFKVAQSFLAGQTPQELVPGESDVFNVAWKTFLAMMERDPAFYATLWQASAAFVLSKKQEALNPNSIKAATQLVAIGYITCALDCAIKQSTTSLNNRDAIFAGEIGPKLLLIAKISKGIKAEVWPTKQDGSLPDASRIALGEFYSVALFTFKELRANVGVAFHEGIDLAMADFKYVMAQHNLPLLLNVDERAALASAREGVTPLLKRPGIATGPQSRSADVLTFRIAPKQEPNA